MTMPPHLWSQELFETTCGSGSPSPPLFVALSLSVALQGRGLPSWRYFLSGIHVGLSRPLLLWTKSPAQRLPEVYTTPFLESWPMPRPTSRFPLEVYALFLHQGISSQT
jgi:hypothetical protein